MLEIDWQGAEQVRRRTTDPKSGRAGCTGIFVLPPSRAELERRLRERRTDSDAVIARRLQDAVSDMRHYHEFDYVIVNDDFERALDDLERVIADGGRELQADRPQLRPLLDELLA
jgi:guanylate kinase